MTTTTPHDPHRIAPLTPLPRRLVRLALDAGYVVASHRSMGLVFVTFRRDGHTRGYLACSRYSGQVQGAVLDHDTPGGLPTLDVSRVMWRLAGRARLGQHPGDLAAQLAAEDDAEGAGELAGDDRLTCHACQDWAPVTHRHEPLSGRLVST